MDINEISSYLVKLGFEVDRPQLVKFEDALKQASSASNLSFGSIVKTMVGVQAGVTGALTSVATGVAALADHVAMSDQKARLFALHMYMSKDAAQSLQISVNALGESMQDIAWDPELHARFIELQELQKRMLVGMGSPAEAEARLKTIRDVRFEFTKLQVEFELLSRMFVLDVFKALGVGPENLLEKLRSVNEWIQDNGDNISDFFSEHFLPLLDDWKKIMSDLKPFIGDLGLVFVNLIGIISGDTSLEGTKLTFGKIADAVKDVTHWLDTFVKYMIQAEHVLVDFALAAELLKEGKKSEAIAKFKEGLSNITAGSSTVAGMATGAVATGVAGAAIGSAAGPVGTVVLGAVGLGVGAVSGGLAGYKLGDRFHQHTDAIATSALEAYHKFKNDAEPIKQAIVAAAEKAGVDINLALAVAKQESGFHQYDDKGNVLKSKAGAEGVFQLMPSTAKDLGVDPADTQANINGGIKDLSQLLAKYHGNVQETLAAYDWGQGNVDKAIRAGKSFAGTAETRDYIQKIQPGPTTVQVQVNVASNASPQEIGRQVATQVASKMNNQTLAALTQTSGTYK